MRFPNTKLRSRAAASISVSYTHLYLIPLFEYLTPYLIADGVQGITLNGVWPFFGYCTIAAETAE